MYNKFTTRCNCGGLTSKAYARQHDGKCKSCFTGVIVDKSFPCPDCDGRITAWQKARGYHCDNCTREADPIGYANECRGLYDGPDY